MLKTLEIKLKVYTSVTFDGFVSNLLSDIQRLNMKIVSLFKYFLYIETQKIDGRKKHMLNLVCPYIITFLS